MKRALVLGETVCQIVAPGGEFPVAPGLTWVDCPNDAEASPAWEYVGGVVKKRTLTKAEENAPVLAALAAADLKSIRGLREFVVAKFGADPLLPGAVKTIETAAVAERAKLKP